jgi:diguanylate cyclase (GGDEF)-like protein
VDAAATVFLAVHDWAGRHGCRPLLARTHYHLALTHHYLGDQTACLEHMLSAVELLDDAALPGIRILHLLRLANALSEAGSPDAARQRYVQAERIALEHGDEARRMIVVNNLALLELENGDVEVAWAVVERMHESVTAMGRDFLISERDTIANVQIGLGQYADAERTLRDVYDAPPWFEVHDAAYAALTLAQAQRHLGALGRARDSLDRCRRLCDENELAGVRVLVLAEQAELFAATGDFQDAFEHYKQFHIASEEQRNSQHEARARTRQAMLETAEARRDAERYREQARRDPLTGLYNRRYVNERLPQAIAEAEAAGRRLTVALLDLDHFKRINDTVSHDAGDKVLVAVGRLLATAPDCWVARLGGEEFLMVLPAVGAATRLDTNRRRIKAHNWSPITGELPVTVSIGAASTVPGDGSDQSDLLAEADRRLYQAKNAGRDRVVYA